MPSTRTLRSSGAAKVEAPETSKVTKPKKETKPKKVSPPPSNSTGKEINEGDPIPDITLLNQDDESLSLKDLAKKHDLIVIFAYPKASTPGCTRQACGFRDNFNSIKDKALILGLSADSPKSQKNFQTKQGLQFDLLSDPKKELIGLLGAKKSPSGIKRSHWIFQKGVLVEKRIQISPEVSFKDGKAKVLELSA